MPPRDFAFWAKSLRGQLRLETVLEVPAPYRINSWTNVLKGIIKVSTNNLSSKKNYIFFVLSSYDRQRKDCLHRATPVDLRQSSFRDTKPSDNETTLSSLDEK